MWRIRDSRRSKPRVAWAAPRPPGSRPIWMTKNRLAPTKAAQRNQRYLGTFFMAERRSILSPPFQPLQGIEGLGLVAELEVEALALERAGVADDGHRLTGPDHVADLGQELRAVSVERVV